MPLTPLARALLPLVVALPAAAQRPASPAPAFPPPVGAGAAPTETPAAGASPAAARRGPWATLVLGRGDVTVACDICRPDDQASFAATLAVGGTLTPRMRLGGELQAWRRGEESATQRVLGVGAIAQLYPVEHRRGFVRLGLSVLDFRVTDDEDELGANAIALAAGFGWEIAVRRGYSVVPFAQLVHGPATGLSLNDARITDGATLKLLQFGLGLGVGR